MARQALFLAALLALALAHGDAAVDSQCTATVQQGERSCPSCAGCFAAQAPAGTVSITNQQYDAATNQTTWQLTVNTPEGCKFTSLSLRLRDSGVRLPLLDPEAADGLRSADVLPILGCDAETGLSNSLIVLLTRSKKADNGSTAFSLRFEGDRPASSLLLPASSLSVADGTGKDISPGESDAAPSFAGVLSGSPRQGASACSFVHVVGGGAAPASPAPPPIQAPMEATADQLLAAAEARSDPTTVVPESALLATGGASRRWLLQERGNATAAVTGDVAADVAPFTQEDALAARSNPSSIVPGAVLESSTSAGGEGTGAGAALDDSEAVPAGELLEILQGAKPDPATRVALVTSAVAAPEKSEAVAAANRTEPAFECPLPYSIYEPACGPSGGSPLPKSAACPACWISSSSLNGYGASVTVSRTHRAAANTTTFAFAVDWRNVDCSRVALGALPVAVLCRLARLTVPLAPGTTPLAIGHLPTIEGAAVTSTFSLSPECDAAAVGAQAGLRNTVAWEYAAVQPSALEALTGLGGEFASIVLAGDVAFGEAFLQVSTSTFVSSELDDLPAGLADGASPGSLSFLVEDEDGGCANGFFEY